MRYVVMLFLILSSCAPKAGSGESQVSPVCTPYASPYEVQYQDGSIHKSQVSACSSGLYEATALDESGASESVTQVMIRLKAADGSYFLTSFN